MSRIYPIEGDHPLVPALKASFDAARAFGLNEAEIWAAVKHAMCGTCPGEDLSEYVELIHAELASAVLTKSAMQTPALH